jgi:hypothetical protein
MAKGKKENVQTLTNLRLRRIIGTSSRSLEFSSPAPGRPKVVWVVGINPGIVRGLWPSQEELPYEERKLPRHISSRIPDGHRPRKCYLKAKEMPKEGFKCAVERHLTGKETEPWEIIYFKVSKSQFQWSRKLSRQQP